MKSDQTSIGNYNLTQNKQGLKRPKEIEEVFDSTMNFYRHTSNNNNTGYKENQQMVLHYQKTMQSVHKHQNTSCDGSNGISGLMRLTTMNTVGKKKTQGPSCRIAKKNCQDDEAQPYNTLVSYKRGEEPKSCENSIGSSLSSSPSLATSIQKHTTQFENAQHRLTNAFKTLDTQAFSIPTSTQSNQNQMFQEIKNISHTLNNRAIANKQYMKDKTPLSNQSIEIDWNMRLALNGKCTQFKKGTHFASLESNRLQQKLMKPNENQQIQPSRLTLTNHKQGVQQLSMVLKQQAVSQRNSINIISKSMKPVTSIKMPGAANPLHVHKLQGKPQAKKLDSDQEETIDSQDMSNSRIAKELIEGNDHDNYDILQRSPTELHINKVALVTALGNPHSKLTQHTQMSNQTSIVQFHAQQIVCNESSSRQLTTQSQDPTQNANVPNSATQRLPNLNHFKGNNYRSTSSASKRARWDVSASRNSIKKGNESDNNTNHQYMASGAQKEQVEVDDDQAKIEMLQRQYMAIKKQLKELQISKSKQHRNQIERSQEREVVGVLSPDIESEYDEEEEEEDLDNDNSYDSGYGNQHQSQQHMRKHKTLDNTNTRKTYNQTAKKQVRKKKEPTQFKSLDIQFEPQILQTSYKQSPDHNFSSAKHSALKNFNCCPSTNNKHKSQFYNNDYEQCYSKSNKIKKGNVMRSQLELGLRKLSINKSRHENEFVIMQQYNQAAKKKQSSSQGQRKAHKGVLKSAQTKIHKKQNSQVSFVDVYDSSNSSYHDCLSGPRSAKSKHLQQRCGSVMSSGSSRYQLANESICSCCREELEITSKKMQRKNSKQIGHWLNQSNEKHHPFKNATNKRSQKVLTTNQHQTTHRKQRKIQEKDNTRSKDNREISRSKERIEYKSSKKNQKENFDEVKSQRTTNRNNEDVKSAAKRRDKSKEKQKSRSKSREMKKQSNEVSLKQFNVKEKNLQHVFQQQNHWINQSIMPFQNNALLAQPLLNQQQLYLQSLAQPQMLQQSFNPSTQSYPMLFANQQPILPLQQSMYQNNTPQISQLLSPQVQTPNLVSKSVNLASISSFKNENLINLPLQTQDLSSQQHTIQQHKEQIETIEELIKMAKQKLEHNINSNVNQSCRLQQQYSHKTYTDNRRNLLKRHDQIDHQNAYNSQRNEYYSNQQMYRTQTSDHLDTLHLEQMRQQYSERNNKFMSKRYSEQNDLHSNTNGYQINSQRVLHFDKEECDKSNLPLSKHLQEYYDSKAKNKEAKNMHDQNNSLTQNEQSKNQHQQSIDNFQLHANESISRNEHDQPDEKSKKEEKSGQKEILWIGFDDKPNQKTLPKRKQLSSTKVQFQHRKQSQDPFPQSIPEEKEEDFNSPEQPLNKLTFGIKLKQDEEATQRSAQKEAWVMDFTDKNEKDKEAKNFSEAFKNRMESMERRFKKGPNKKKKEFTKQELLERKRELLKNARLSAQQLSNKNKEDLTPLSQPNQSLIQENDSTTTTAQTKVIKIDITSRNTQSSKNDNIPLQLLTRLSSGQKPEITKKDMLRLTSKNYEQLPEVQKRKQEANKKEEVKKRLAYAKELDKQRRQSILNKKVNKEQQKKSIKVNEESTTV